MVTELIEELEVRCRYGVKEKKEVSKYGVIGDHFVERPDGCKVVLMMKGIFFLFITLNSLFVYI